VDGARVLFPHGWGPVRASNTQPVLVMRFEAATPDLLKEYQAEVEARAKKNAQRRDPPP
jgi:phosphomannomutase/phosphoglucomutase